MSDMADIERENSVIMAGDYVETKECCQDFSFFPSGLRGVVTKADPHHLGIIVKFDPDVAVDRYGKGLVFNFNARNLTLVDAVPRTNFPDQWVAL